MFYSPIGWLTLIVFIIHSAFIVSGRIDSILTMYELRGVEHSNFTSDIFSTLRGLFRTMSSNFYLYVPLLTMGLLSKEYNDGGIKLLFSSPIKTSEIVLGKFSALMVYALLLLSIYVLLAVLVRIFVADSADVLLFTAGIVQNYLMICLYISIGLFISSLTSYQLAAAVGTFAVLFVFNNYLNTLVQESHPEILQLLFGVWLPPNFHSEAISGLMNSGDLFYYLILTTLFLSLTYVRLQFLRESRSFWGKIATYGSIVMILVSIGLFTYTPDRFNYFDFTDNKTNSFSEEQRQVFAQLAAPLTFTKYTHVLESPSEGSILGFSGRIRSTDRLRRSLKLKPDLTFIPFFAQTTSLNLTYLSDDTRYSDAAVLAVQTPTRLNRSTDELDLIDLAKYASEKYSWLNFEDMIGPDEINVIIDTTLVRYNSTYIIESDNKSTELRIGLSFPSDQELTAAVKTMFTGPINIGFISGTGERSPFKNDDPHYFRIFNNSIRQYALINQGFELQSLNFTDQGMFDDIDILMIADPVNAYSVNQNSLIMEYIESGRNLMIATSHSNRENTKNILEHLGLYPESRQSERAFAKIYPPVVGYNGNPDGFLVNKVARYQTRNATLLDDDGSGSEISIKDASPLLRIDNNLEFVLKPVLVSVTDTLIYALSRNVNGAEQRIIVAGDADFLSNGIEGIGFQSAYGTGKVNPSFALSLFRWLSNDEYPVLVERDIKLGRLKAYNFDLFKWAIVILIPLPLIFLGSVVIYRRKRK